MIMRSLLLSSSSSAPKILTATTSANLLFSIRFARSRASPPTTATSPEHELNPSVDESDELLMMGLRPLADIESSSSSSATNDNSETTIPSTSSAQKSSSSYPAKSSFNHFFKKSVSDAKKKKQNDLFGDLMSDLKNIKEQQIPTTTTTRPIHQDRQQRSENRQQLPKKKSYDPAFLDLMRSTASKSKHLENLAPELERMQRNRSLLIRKWTKQDVAEIVRRQSSQASSNFLFQKQNQPSQQKSSADDDVMNNSSPSTKMLDILDSKTNSAREEMRRMIVSEVDPMEAKAREEANFQFQEAVKDRARELYLLDKKEKENDDINAHKEDDDDDETTTEQDYYEEAAFDLIEGMSDQELQVIVKSGALDIDALWEGNAELSSLPNEYLQNDGVLQLTRELADMASPQLPNDDEAQALVSADKGDREDFFQNRNQLKTLENYERRNAYSYVEQPNLVLKHLARDDEKIKESLDSMDRAKRLLLRDGEFQSALAYVQQMEQQEVSQANVAPKMRKSAAEVAVRFFDEGHSRPPKKAMSSVPQPVKKGVEKSIDPMKVAMRREKKRSEEMFVNKTQKKGGNNDEGELNQWYD